MRGNEFAWRVHAAQEQWTTRADSKAAVVFTVETAIIAVVVAALGSRLLSDEIFGWRRVFAWVGIAVCVVAILCAGLVVVPRLGHGRVLRSEEHFIYFGHLRFWNSANLAEKLSVLTDKEELEELSIQLVRLGVTNWRKYVLIQVSVTAALLGAGLFALAFAWPR